MEPQTEAIVRFHGIASRPPLEGRLYGRVVDLLLYSEVTGCD